MKSYPKTSEEICRNFAHSFVKIFFLLLISLFSFSSSKAAGNPVSVTGLVSINDAIGTLTYPNLTAAFNAINSGSIKGDITIKISGSTDETISDQNSDFNYGAVLYGSGSTEANNASSYTSISIMLDIANAIAGQTITIKGNSKNWGVISFFGADNVTLDGCLDPRNGVFNRDLVITNINSISGNYAKGIAIMPSLNNSTNSANNITVKNCRIKNDITTTKMYSGIFLGRPCSNVTISNNLVCKAISGITQGGGNSNLGGTNLTINNNYIGSATNVNDKIFSQGILIADQLNVSVYSDTICGVVGNDIGNNITSGICFYGTNTEGIVYSNIISDIKNTNSGGWSADGICLALNSNAGAGGLKIYNNFIYDIAGIGFSSASDNGHGISVTGGFGYNIYNNSINLTTNQTNNTGISSCIYIASNVSRPGAIDLRNNILSNQQTSGTRYSIYSSATSSTIFLDINNNDYFTISGTNIGNLGGIIKNTLAEWRLATGKDASSLSINPQYISTTNLHLNTLSSTLDARAVPIQGINKDIDNDNRDLATPDIGADEFTPAPCSPSSVTGGNISSSSTFFCGSGSLTLNAFGYTIGSGMNYYWQSSTDNGSNWSDIPGATNPVQYLTTVSVTTKFRLRVNCSNNPSSTYSSNEITVTVASISVNTPITVGARCGIGTTTCNATAANGTATINWYSDANKINYLGTSNSGANWTTPEIRTTTTFYAAANGGTQAADVGAISATSSNFRNENSPTPGGFNFTTTVPNITINSVLMPYTGSGSMTFQVYDEFTGLPIATPTTVTVPDGGGSSSLKVVSLGSGINIPSAGNYYLLLTSYSGVSGFKYNFTSDLGVAFPFSALDGNVKITSTSWLTNFNLSNLIEVIYGMNVSKQCVGPAQSVTVNVTPPTSKFKIESPAAATADTTICQGSSVTLTVSNNVLTPANPPYSFTWSNGFTGPSQTVIPYQTTIYTVSANNGTCRIDSNITVNVNPTPTALDVTPPSQTVCNNSSILTLTASGGTFPSRTVYYTQNIEGYTTSPGVPFALPEYTPQIVPNIPPNKGGAALVLIRPETYYYYEGRASMLLRHQDLSRGEYYYMNRPYDINSFNNVYLTFAHIARLEPNDTALIEYSNDGNNWKRFPKTAYINGGTRASASLGTSDSIFFNVSSYSDWNFYEASQRYMPPASTARNLWRVDTIDLTPFKSANFRIRFGIKSDGNNIRYAGWYIDDIKISYKPQVSITWDQSNASPTTTSNFLFSNSTATTPIGTTAQNTAYFKAPNTAARTYYCIASTPSSTNACFRLKDTAIVIYSTSATPSVTITANRTNVCQNDTTLFTANVNNYTGVTQYKWFRNISKLNASSNSTTVTVPSTNGLYIGATVYVGSGIGTGTFATTGSTVLTIPSSTTFTVGANPTTTLSNATVLAQVNSSNLTNNYGFTLFNTFNSANSSNDTITIPSTTNLYVGGTVTVSSGTGAFSPNTTVIAIPSSTKFVVSATPTTPLINATVKQIISNYAAGPANSFTFSFPNGSVTDEITCQVSGGTGSCGSGPTVAPSNNVSVFVGTTPPTITAIAGANGSVTPPGTTAVNCGTNSQAYVVTANSGFSIDTVIITKGGAVTTIIRPSSPYPYTFTDVSGTNNSIRAVFYNPNCLVSPSAVAGSNVTMCGVKTLSLSSATVTGPTGIGATWSTSGSGSFNGGTTWGSTTGYLPSAVDSALGSVNLTLTTNLPPGSGSGCVVSVSTFTITIKPTPAATLTGALGLCNSATSTPLSITATMAPGTGNVLGYYWYNGSTLLNPGGVSSSSMTFTTTPPTNISNVDSVKIPASNGCTTAIPLPIVINATSPTSTAISGTDTICVDNTSTLTATYASMGTGATSVSYQWSVGGVAISGTNNPTYVAPYPAVGSNSYTVTITNNLGCYQTTTSAFTVYAASSRMYGEYTIYGSGSTPTCRNYTSFKNAIADLNTRSISGPVTFLVAAGITEVVPLNGLKLGSTALNTASINNSISFIKSGEGANPKLYNYANTTGTATSQSATPDGIWSLNGIDNVTIDGIDLADTGSVATAGPLMEYGYGLFKASATDGAQNNTIRNCTITLNKANNAIPAGSMVEGSTGILVINSTNSAATGALTPSATSGSNSRNKFYTNTISNCNHGIAIIGYHTTSTAYADTLNDIGGSDASLGNTVTNFGGGGTSNSYGIRTQGQRAVNISYNIINNNDGNGLFPQGTGTLNGISNTGTSAGGNTTINNNIVTVKGGAASGTVAITAINNSIGANGRYSVNINNNIITGQHSNSTTGTWSGIINASTNATAVNIDNNRLDNCTFPSTASVLWTGIENKNLDTTLSISNNVVNNCNIASTGSMVCISNSSSSVNNLTMNGNSVTGNTKGTTTAITSWMNAAANQNINVSQNTITNNTMAIGSISSPTFAINCVNIVGATGSSSYTASGNTIYKNSLTGISTTGTGVVQFRAINFQGSTINETVSNNNIANLSTSVAASGTNASAVYGVYSSNNLASSNKNFSNNIIDSFATQGADVAVVGINNEKGGYTLNIYKNKISRLYAAGTASATKYVSGIRVLAVSVPTPTDFAACNIHNNMINMDLGSASANSNLSGTDALKGIDLALSTTQVNVNVFYNTVLLARTGATGNAAFGSSAISSAGTSSPVNYTNNIFVNRINTSSGLSVALRRAGLGAFSSLSNNNLYFAGTASASNLLYYDGTNSSQTITELKTTLSPRESSSLSLDPVFVSTTDLHLSPNSNCTIDGAGKVIAGYATDIDEQLRDTVLPDIGADEQNQTGGTGTWKGYNTDWNNAKNWCGILPTSTTNVQIDSAKQKYPIITDGTNNPTTPVCNNITIKNGASVTVTGLNSKLTISGSITNSGIFDVKYGTIELAGSTTQIIPQGSFTNNNIRNLIIKNSSEGTSVSLLGVLNVLGKLSFADTTTTRNFATNDNLTLKSSDTLTANVGIMGSRNKITGNVTVERYCQPWRAWRFLSMPTKHNLQTIHQAWQENQAPNSTNSTGGYGIHITSAFGGSIAGAQSLGFDSYTSAGPSMKYYSNTLNGSWIGIPSTISTTNYSGKFEWLKPYMTLVRGDRTINYFISNQGATVPTILREKGELKESETDKNVIINGIPGSGSLSSALFYAVGNPFASAIDISGFSFKNDQNQEQNIFVSVWDPRRPTSIGLGGWVTFGKVIGSGGNVNYACDLCGPSGSPSYSYTNTYPFIESGQGFMIQSFGTSTKTLTINESSKVDGSHLVSRGVSDNSKHLKIKLLRNANGTDLLSDGALCVFDNGYQNILDNNDAFKMTNPGENLGLKCNSKILAIESRSELQESDTIFMNISQLVSGASYKLKFEPQAIDQTGLQGYLEDLHLHTSTPVSLSDSTIYNFNITSSIPSSYVADRFRIVFKQLAPVPVSFLSIGASQQNDDVMVNWKVENEMNINKYVVQHSVDGLTFSDKGLTLATGNGVATAAYEWLDGKPGAGLHYYRIKSISNSGETKFSEIVKVNIESNFSNVSISPNPVAENRQFKISISDMPKGLYKMTVINTIGQNIMTKTIDYPGGNAEYNFELSKKTSHGSYNLKLINSNKDEIILKFVF